MLTAIMHLLDQGIYLNIKNTVAQNRIGKLFEKCDSYYKIQIQIHNYTTTNTDKDK